MYDDSVRICVARMACVFSRVRASCSLYEQITSGYFAFFRDHAHSASSRIVVYFLKTSKKLIEGKPRNKQTIILYLIIIIKA